MPRGTLGPTARAVLACIPRDDGSGDVAEAHEIQARTGLSRNVVDKALSRAVKRGLVVRVRVGAYQRTAR